MAIGQRRHHQPHPIHARQCHLPAGHAGGHVSGTRILNSGESHMKKTNEKGVALILTMILLLLISIMGVSLMFVSQTETWSSLNYRLMSQARDGAEAGINAAANYLMFTYVPPA